MNRIECHFGVMVKAVFSGSDYRDHPEIQAAVAAYLRRRNCPASQGCRLIQPIASLGCRSPIVLASISNGALKPIA